MNELTLKMIAHVQYAMSITIPPRHSPMLMDFYGRYMNRLERIERYLIRREARS